MYKRQADALAPLVASLGRLAGVPGVFVFGSNDYFAPVPKNPLPYLGIGEKTHSEIPLPWRDLRAAFTERGWVDVTHRRAEIAVDGRSVLVAGVDDPHIGRDRYDEIAGPAGPAFDLRIGLTHAPEPRVLDRFDADGYDLALAGHTHGGQVTLLGLIVPETGSKYGRRFLTGLNHNTRGIPVITSNGLGTSRKNIRTGARSDVVVVTLKRTETKIEERE